MNAWFKELDRAKTEAELVATTRDYVSLYSPPELAKLPEDCREIRIETEADIPRWKEKLVDGYSRVRARADSPHLQNLVTYMSLASERLGTLRRDN